MIWLRLVEKDGAFFSILDQKPMSAFSTPGSAYTEAMAKQIYGLVKGSAKANKRSSRTPVWSRLRMRVRCVEPSP